MLLTIKYKDQLCQQDSNIIDGRETGKRDLLTSDLNTKVNLYPPPNLNSNMLRTDLKGSSTTRMWLNPVSTRKLLG